jgi:hypothetical protein
MQLDRTLKRSSKVSHLAWKGRGKPIHTTQENGTRQDGIFGTNEPWDDIGYDVGKTTPSVATTRDAIFSVGEPLDATGQDVGKSTPSVAKRTSRHRHRNINEANRSRETP